MTAGPVRTLRPKPKSQIREKTGGITQRHTHDMSNPESVQHVRVRSMSPIDYHRQWRFREAIGHAQVAEVEER